MQMPSLLSLQAALVALMAASQTLALPNNASAAAPAPEHTVATKSYCGWYGNVGPFEIYTAGWGRNDNTSRGGCGSGLLNSLRDQCSPWTISQWGCEHPRPSANDHAHGAVSTFKLQGAWFNAIWTACIERAISHASPTKERVKCRNMAHDE